MELLLLGISLVLVLFVWTWIGLTIIQRLNLERKIEKLDLIENRLPEEERSLAQLKELSGIEANKIGSAKLVLGLFGLLVGGGILAPVFYAPMRELFGFDNLLRFETLAWTVLTFMVVPT